MTQVPTNASEAAGPVNVVDSLEQFEIYDRLPARLREVIDQAPISMDMREVAAVVAMYGKHSARELIIEALTATYPQWAFRPGESTPIRHRRQRP